MGILRPFPPNAVRSALLAAVLTVLVMALLLLFPFDALRPDAGSAPPASPPAASVPAVPVVRTAPAWLADPVVPVSIPGASAAATTPAS